MGFLREKKNIIGGIAHLQTNLTHIISIDISIDIISP
jgi:hypothetical protein